MLITVEVNNCRQCRHRDHSGGFTHGGARGICGHSDSCKERKTIAEFEAEYPMYAGEMSGDKKNWRYHWYNRIVDENENKIPSWCPLKHGSSY